MDFIKIHFLDVIDILLVAVLIYQLYRLVRRTNAMSIFAGILMILLLLWAVRTLKMELTSMILGQVISVGGIALIIVFQPEIRKFLFLVGDRYGRQNTIVRKILFPRAASGLSVWTEELVAA